MMNARLNVESHGFKGFILNEKGIELYLTHKSMMINRRILWASGCSVFISFISIFISVYSLYK